ncbi:MAG: hypothetical protein ABW189_03235 [Rickettsiales bacterium]
MQKTLRTKIASIEREMDGHTAAVAKGRQEVEKLEAALTQARMTLRDEREALANISKETLHFASFGAAFFAGQEERIDVLLHAMRTQEARIENHLEEIRGLFGEKEKYRLLLEQMREKAKHAATLKEEIESDERIRQRERRKVE